MQQKSFAVRFWFNGRPRKLTLAKGLTLAEARAEAAAAILKVHRGSDPTIAKRKAREAQQAAAADTFRAIAESYLHRERKEAALSGVAAKVVSAPRLSANRRHPDCLDQAQGDHRTARQGRGRQRAHDGAFNLGRHPQNHELARDEGRELREPDRPRDGKNFRPKERARSRILSDEELRAVWKTAKQRADPFAAMVRFLLLTAGAPNRSRGDDVERVDGADWLLPAARNKVGIDLCRPLSRAARELLDAQPRIDGCPYVFTYGRSPLGFGRHKAVFDGVCGVTGWVLHDLRRTARSLMSRAGVNADHAERCLGHVIGGVRGIYDRHEYLAEKRHAFEGLAAQIELIVHPPNGNVRQLRG